jgi:hypothetical protein
VLPSWCCLPHMIWYPTTVGSNGAAASAEQVLVQSRSTGFGSVDESLDQNRFLGERVPRD